MKRTTRISTFTATCLFLSLAAACAVEGEGGAEGVGEGEGEDIDIPPTGSAAAIEDWIATGQYLGWACEAAAHAPRAPSPHPQNRICNNPLLATSTAGAAIPLGAASVKEIFDAAGEEIVAYAVTTKVAAGGAADGAAYHYYEGDLVNAAGAFGTGASGGVSETVCFGCHTQSENPEYGGQEQFFTIVR